MGSESQRGSSSGPDTDFPRLEALLREHFGRFGRDVCDLLVISARKTNGLEDVLKKLGIVSEDDTFLRIGRLISWLDTNGSRALFQRLAPEASNYKLKPVEPSDSRQHDQRLLELVVKTRKPSPPVAASTPHPSPEAVYPSPVPPAAPGYPSPPAIPARPGAAPPAAQASAPPPAVQPPPRESPQKDAVSSSNIPPDGPFTGPPGYPYPWPPHLRPGPVAPPHNIPPEQLSWPHIERRSGKERREKKDRRSSVDVIYKNRRFGGERRKGDRRKGGGGKPSS